MTVVRLRRRFTRPAPGKRACRSTGGECEPAASASRTQLTRRRIVAARRNRRLLLRLLALGFRSVKTVINCFSLTHYQTEPRLKDKKKSLAKMQGMVEMTGFAFLRKSHGRMKCPPDTSFGPPFRILLLLQNKHKGIALLSPCAYWSR